MRIEEDDTEGAWAACVRSAVREVFPERRCREIERIETFGAMVYLVRERAQLLDKPTPCDVLSEFENIDVWFAGEADDSAAFLAATIGDLH